MKGLSIAKNLKQIVLADNQFLEEDEVLEAINDCMVKNQNLGRYDFKYNFISDYGKWPWQPNFSNLLFCTV